jgi:type II secretory pathway pseudopilin PulG
MNSKVLRPRAGAFTLVEVMVAAGVMAAAIVGMIQVVISGSEMLDVSRKQTVAMQIIHAQIDNIRLSNWTTVNALPTASTSVTIQTSLQPISQGFTCNRVISLVRTDLKQITFTVGWTGNTGRTYTRSGSTYVGKNGLYVTYQRS